MNTYQRKSNDTWKFPLYEVGEEIPWEQLCQKFSWLQDMKIVPQDKEWHAEGDVYTHTKMVVNDLVNSPEYKELNEQEQHILFAAAIMHDIEKRSTTITEIKDGVQRIKSPRHAVYGESTIRNMLYKDMVAPYDIREQIAKLVRWHGLPFWVIETNTSVKKVINASLQVDTFLLYLLARSDARGRECVDMQDTLLKIELYKELCLDNDCYGKSKEFSSKLARYHYLNSGEVYPVYESYDDHEFEVIVMCAVPGTGKDTYIKNELDIPMLSLDELRIKNKVQRGDKKMQGRMIQEAKEQAKVFMRQKQSFVFNATNTTKDMRARWISLFMEYRAKVKIVYLETSYQKLKSQNKDRAHEVPLEALDKLYERLEMPTFEEAHEVEYLIRN